MEEWLTPRELAAVLKVSLRTVRRWLAEARLPYLQPEPGGLVRIPKAAIILVLKGPWTVGAKRCRLCPYFIRENLEQFELVEKYLTLKEKFQ